MHSHDRTLLASLGFADPDRNDPLHDVACRYITRPDVANKLGAYVFGERTEPKEYARHERDEPQQQFRGTKWREIGPLRSARCEVPISKGDGRYRTTIGFLDVTLEFPEVGRTQGETRKRVWVQATYQHDPSRWNNQGDVIQEAHHAWTPWEPHSTSSERLRHLYAEVKANQLPIGQVLRQIELYKQYLGGFHPFLVDSDETVSAFLLATCYRLKASELDQLKAARIRHAYLGEAFQQYAREQAQQESRSQGFEL